MAMLLEDIQKSGGEGKLLILDPGRSDSALTGVMEDIKLYFHEMTRRIKVAPMKDYDNDPLKFVDFAYRRTLQKYIQGTHPHRGMLLVGNLIWAILAFFMLYVAAYVSFSEIDGDLRGDLAVMAAYRVDVVLYCFVVIFLIPAAIGIVASVR